MKAIKKHSDNQLQNNISSLKSRSHQTNKDHGSSSISSVNELEEFYDPYSDLNLFLVQKITKEMPHCGNAKKWSLKIQEELLKRISPEFQKRFPLYRLGVSALKKTWEKITYYSQQIQHQKEAITQDGKLNIHFFIRENLKQLSSFKSLGPLHPSHFAHQLGVKMGECIATIDGVRPKIDHLTQLIWSIQRHLLCASNLQNDTSHYNAYDKIDQVIVKAILDITAKDPQIAHNELQHRVKETLHALLELPSFGSLDDITGNISALLAEKLYPSSPFHYLFTAQQKAAIGHFIRRHSCLYKAGTGPLQLTELVRRICALYALASGLPKHLSDEEILCAIKTYYPTPSNPQTALPQSLYAFISAELVLMRNEEYCYSCAFVNETILSAYKEAILLPDLHTDHKDTLDIVIWKTLSEMESLLEKLPYKNGLRIEEEIANITLENPTQGFSFLVHATVQFFKGTKELVKAKNSSDIERKIHNWVMQGDMLYRWIQLDQDSPLMQLICREWQSLSSPLPHHLFVSYVCQRYLKQHPEMTLYAGQLAQRIWIHYKYAWYTLFSTEQESSYDRFLKWHALSFLNSSGGFSKEHCIENLQELVKRSLPLVPFERKHCEAILESLSIHNRV